jgi:DNA-binding LacI/PurR family transcriptional regulator
MARTSLSRPTIADVAQAAGVSKSTVSRVLMGNLAYMRDDTRQRVEQAITALNYSPSSVARSLVTKRTHTVGLLVSDVGNPFYPEVIHSVEDVALAHGYDVFLCNTNYNPERGLQILRSLIAKQVDGVMIMSSSMSDEWVIELVKQEVPTVVLDWQISHLAGEVSTIKVDFETGVREAAAHLIELGHRRFAHISGPLNMRTSLLRRDAFLKALADFNVDPAAVVIIEGDLRIESGRKALNQLMALNPRPTAVFTANDMMALGLIWAAREVGLQIPRDLSVVGLDNIRLAAEINPPLTTIALPQSEIGRLAMESLLELFDRRKNAQEDGLALQVDTHLVIRNSTCQPGSTVDN